MAKAANQRSSILGFAKPPHIASVFFDRVANLAESGAVEETHNILGHLLAHELGHLLLARNGHSRRGIMQIPWKAKELKLAAQGRLLFTEGQSKRMGSQVSTRMRKGSISESGGTFLREAEGCLDFSSDQKEACSLTPTNEKCRRPRRPRSPKTGCLTHVLTATERFLGTYCQYRRTCRNSQSPMSQMYWIESHITIHMYKSSRASITMSSRAQRLSQGLSKKPMLELFSL